MNAIPARRYADLPYVRIDSLPEEDQVCFSAWISRQTCPVVSTEIDVSGEPAACAYAWDYARWLAEYKPVALSNPYDT